MIAAVTSAISDILSWVGSVITSLTSASGELNALLPLFAIGVAVSAVMLGIRVIRGFIWGA